MHNVEKWPNILKKSSGVKTARFLKYNWPFFSNMYERVNLVVPIINVMKVSIILRDNISNDPSKYLLVQINIYQFK